MFNLFQKKEKRTEECDHTFFPYRDSSNKIYGQKCSICQHINSLEDMNLTEESIKFIRDKM